MASSSGQFRIQQSFTQDQCSYNAATTTTGTFTVTHKQLGCWTLTSIATDMAKTSYLLFLSIFL